MDHQIIFMALTAFLLCIGALIFVFHVTPTDAAVSWLFRTVIVMGLGEGWYVSQYFTPTELLYFLLIYILLVMLFMVSIFSVIEASITLRILAEIVHSTHKGLSKDELKRRYNKNRIVTKRLSRFIESGELQYENGLYRRGKRSYYTWREYIVAFMRWAFPIRA